MPKVLIVDDEPNVCLVIQTFLETEGYQTWRASNIVEAEEALAREEYHLMTLDINMPSESGLDFLERIGADHPDLAVLMVTLIDDMSTVKRAIESGAYGYISKPFEREEMIIAVHSALRRRELEIAGRRHQADLEDRIRGRTRQLEESEKRFRLLVEKMSEGLASIDSDRRIKYVNRRFCEMLGYEEEEVLGSALDQFVDASYLEYFRSQISRRQYGFEDRYEIVWRTKNGVRLYSMVSPSALFDQAGNFLGSFGVITDITDLKNAESALIKELAASTALAETAGLLVSSISLEEISGKILEMTQKLTMSQYGFVGYIDPSTGHLVAPTLSTVVWEQCRIKDRESVFKKFGGLWGWVLENKQPILTNEATRDHRSSGTPEGHVRIERFIALPAMLEDRVVGLIGLANAGRDYSEEDLKLMRPYADLFAVALKRKWLEDETRSREKYLRDILDSIATGIIIVDQEKHLITEVNPTAARMIGAPVGDIIGRECWDFACPEKRDCCPMRGDQNSIETFERLLVSVQGTRIPIIKTVAPISISGRPHLLETFVDITAQKQMEFKLAQAQKLEAIGQLAAGIAHEINTPIQFIHGNIEFLEDAFLNLSRLHGKVERMLEVGHNEKQDDKLRGLKKIMEDVDFKFLLTETPEAIDGALDGVERISNIVNSMRYFSHPGIKGKTPIDINEALKNAVTISRNEWKYYAEVRTDLARDLPLLPVYAAEFNQVLLNLIVNAAHAIAEKSKSIDDEKGEILIKTALADQSLDIYIRDTGVGIPENIRSRIYDPFFTTKEVGRGTGQGLAIAYNIVVEKHGGKITFQTEVGRGTTFLIKLPLDLSGEELEYGGSDYHVEWI